jgi:hypothetical protein
MLSINIVRGIIDCENVKQITVDTHGGGELGLTTFVLDVDVEDWELAL